MAGSPEGFWLHVGGFWQGPVHLHHQRCREPRDPSPQGCASQVYLAQCPLWITGSDGAGDVAVPEGVWKKQIPEVAGFAAGHLQEVIDLCGCPGRPGLLVSLSKVGKLLGSLGSPMGAPADPAHPLPAGRRCEGLGRKLSGSPPLSGDQRRHKPLCRPRCIERSRWHPSRHPSLVGPGRARRVGRL